MLPHLGRKKSTHLSFFGNTWSFEFALARTLLEDFSDPNNLLYNAGIVDKDGKEIDWEGNNPQKPAVKKRKKMQTKSGVKNLENKHCAARSRGLL